MTQNLDRKLISKIAKQKLKSGMAKQEIYYELVNEFKNKEEVAKIIAPMPSAARWKKYGMLNTAFLALLILLMVVLLIRPNLSLLTTALLIYITANKKFKYYYWTTIVGVLGLLSSIAIAIYYGTISGFVFLFMILLSLIFIAAGIFLPKLLKPSFTEISETLINSEGKTELVVNYNFGE